MTKNILPKSIIVTEFINSKDERKSVKTFEELLAEGNIFEFYFKYKTITKDGDKALISKATKKSSFIKKLDLYNRIIYTYAGEVFRIRNDFSIVNPRKPEATKRSYNKKKKEEV